ncbi:aminoglycoside phosphotransferase family protein [Streptomyces sp. RKAG337]|uniref:aminoglycoside phosphotransferase family protein n=1 Tax=Streptomyces sp. RKAG337 TaxID=2893404 RepID=UPI0020344AF5|nr:aminoglycoside phosphotransferase family protein [Streptomyces sp. RKAG337]MCM2427046.1 aminoglycoside phosphotransferase family protein [Streptomyces sp. RKAG337]
MSAASEWDELRQLATDQGICMSGYHNLNHVVEIPFHLAELLEIPPATKVKLRIPRSDSLTVVERVWPDEGAVLDALAGLRGIADTPRCFVRREGFSVHEYVEGTALSQLCPPGKPLESRYLDQIVGQLAAFTRVPASALPPLPEEWAHDRDCRAFLRGRAQFAEREVRSANWPEFGPLFTALGVPESASRELRDRLSVMERRPFALLHADVHRDNLIVRADGELCLVDWELAMWGDPLHDLAIHLVRMGYPRDQESEVVERWRRSVEQVRRDAVRGLDDDLPAYIAYERAQSLFADTMRVARALGPHPESGQVGAGAYLVREALRVAAEPLWLAGVPTLTEVARALVGWCRHADRHAAPVTAGRGPSTWTGR